MEILIVLVVGCFWGWVCSNMARHRNRDQGMGFVGGFLFGLFAVIYYAVVGDAK